MKFIITIDTEADNQWTSRTSDATENLACIPRFQALCERYAFPPTYLCTYEVAAAPAFQERLRSLHERGVAEVGSHLHPWSTPPPSAWDRSERGAAYPSELPADVFTEKIERLTTFVADRLGAPPRSYRAGRWGFAAAHIPDLLRLGYIVDCSVTPSLIWTDPGAHGNGPDFSSAPIRPYFLDWNNPCAEGASDLLEVPMTVVHTSAAMRWSPALRTWYRRHRKTKVARVANRLFHVAPQWLRPFPDMTVERLRRVYLTAKQLDLPVIELMFHSSELLPDGSPYNRTPGDVDRLFERLDGLFALLASEHVEGVTLSGFAAPMRANRRVLPDLRARSGLG